ncbi:hypothetical protein NEOLEDRAFT_875893 [Neolentinus lepideus HHB14362 ss-1]|uniref:Uncharacterized protein n=1 Tax=Neolentinus lepideus HHB14362 ss-1 TaxID=1314782 RepID=A0A165P1J0_9AGAM|nr:hypothetical protein NEOLEDRAFT_875893 [Neolentinus lepideus HHB14362 ss-1]
MSQEGGGDDDDDEEEDEEEENQDQKSRVPFTQDDPSANRGRRRNDVDHVPASAPSLNALDCDIELPHGAGAEHPDDREQPYNNANNGFPASPASTAPPQTPEPLPLPLATIMPLRINGKGVGGAGLGSGKVRVVRQRAEGERGVFW